MSEHILNEKIKKGAILNTGFAILEILIGFWSGSLALISDATHNLTDSATLVVSFIAQKISQKKPNQEHTFGYGKAKILAALINSLIMLALAVLIFYSAYNRWQNPHPVNGLIISVIAGLGIAVNGTVAAILFKHRSDLNIRALFLNMTLDTVTSVATLISGVVIYFAHFEKTDALVSAFIGTMMVITCVSIINEAVHILLEGAPEDINPDSVIADLKKFQDVTSVDDFHLWIISSGHPALSCHLVVNPVGSLNILNLTKQAKQMLSEKYNIKQTTIEVGTEKVPEHEH